jgi:hypothetical protein
LEKSIDEMKVELNEYQGKTTNISEIEKQKRLRELNNSLSQASATSSKIEEKYQKVRDKMFSLKGHIENAFDTLDCNEIAPKELNLDDGLTESNMIMYLKIIEKRNMDVILSVSELIKEKEKCFQQINIMKSLKLGPLLAIGKNETLKTNQNELFTKVEPTKLEINSDDLLLSSNIDDFRKRIESKLKTSNTPSVEEYD